MYKLMMIYNNLITIYINIQRTNTSGVSTSIYFACARGFGLALAHF